MFDKDSKTSEETNIKTNYTNNQLRCNPKVNLNNNSTTPNNKSSRRPLSTKSYTSSNKERKLITKSATLKDRQNDIKESNDNEALDNGNYQHYIVKILDNMIYDIKKYGFDYIKQVIFYDY